MPASSQRAFRVAALLFVTAVTAEQSKSAAHVAAAALAARASRLSPQSSASGAAAPAVRVAAEALAARASRLSQQSSVAPHEVGRAGVPATRPDVDSFTYLDNGVVRLGIDTSRGGTIGFFGPSYNRSLSLLNVHDFGRSVQGSFYSGPSVFDPDGKCSEPGGWGEPWPWNPIGSGDVYLHAAPLLNVTLSPDNTSAIVWTQPMQWACDNVPCDCLFEQHIELLGAAARVRITMHTARADTTAYPARPQELPAVYVIGDFCHLWAYNGSRPFTGDSPVEVPAIWSTTTAWGAFTAGERWMAYTNASGWGVGVVSPFAAHFGAGFFDDGKPGVYDCVPRGLGPYDAETGYISPQADEIIDPAFPYAYNFSLVLGSVGDVRAYAYAEHAARADEPLAPAYDFVARGDRAHCTLSDATDAGLPVGARGLALNVTGPHPLVVGPVSVWPPAAAPRVLVNASYAPALAGGVPALAWVVLGDAAPCAACELPAPAPVVADGAFHVTAFHLAGAPAYAGAPALERLVFLPLGAAAVDPGVVGRPGLVAVASIVADGGAAAAAA